MVGTVVGGTEQSFLIILEVVGFLFIVSMAEDCCPVERIRRVFILKVVGQRHSSVGVVGSESIAGQHQHSTTYLFTTANKESKAAPFGLVHRGERA